MAAVSGANRASWHGGYRRDASQYKRSSAMEPAPDATGAPLPGAPITPLGAFNRVERALAHKRPRAASKPAQRKQAAQGARWCTQTRGLPSDAVAIYTDVAAMRSTARLSPPPESSAPGGGGTPSPGTAPSAVTPSPAPPARDEAAGADATGGAEQPQRRKHRRKETPADAAQLKYLPPGWVVDEDGGVGPPVLCVPMNRRKGESPRCQTRITPLREVFAKAYAQKYRWSDTSTGENTAPLLPRITVNCHYRLKPPNAAHPSLPAHRSP